MVRALSFNIRQCSIIVFIKRLKFCSFEEFPTGHRTVNKVILPIIVILM